METLTPRERTKELLHTMDYDHAEALAARFAAVLGEDNYLARPDGAGSVVIACAQDPALLLQFVRAVRELETAVREFDGEAAG